MIEQELNASQAQVKEIRSALGDDGRRTHKEILEMAFKASGWREWKQKYIDLRNAHIAEGQDPAGTIWEHADKLQKELKETKAEVKRLRSVLQNLTDAVTKRLSDDFQPEAARQLWEAFKVASETLDKR
jgi:F0F1-type ATP synthase membrane subunit b/b'